MLQLRFALVVLGDIMNLWAAVQECKKRRSRCKSMMVH
jgi:hypothetical protein